MRLNGNFFNFMNSSFFNRSAMISKLLGSRNAGSVNVPDKNSVKSFSVLSGAARKIGMGAVICMSDLLMPLNDSALIVPSHLI